MSIGRLLAAVLTTAALFLASSPATTEVLRTEARMRAIEPGVSVLDRSDPIMLSALSDGARTPEPWEAGPPTPLSPRQYRLLFLGFTLPWISATIAVMLAALFAIMDRRRRPALTLLAVSALCWAAFSVSRTFAPALVEGRNWTQAISYLSAGLYACTTTAALLRLTGRKNRRDDWLLWALALAGPLALAVFGDRALTSIDRVWLVALIVVPAAAFLYSIFNRLRAGAAVNHGIAFAVAITLGAACRDYAVLQGGLPTSGFQALDVAAPLLLLAIAVPLVDHFLRALRDTESARAKLEVRVREREQMLERNFELLRQDERIQAAQAERQRIMQDMHDGLGSQLLSSLMLVDRGALSQAQVAQVLRECIDDMRLAIDTLTQQDADFLAAMGNLRYRLEPRFRAAGMQLTWNMRELPDELSIDHAAILPILRILQEALTNAMKHSQARTVAVDMRIDSGGDDPRLIVRVADDGVGTLGERPGSRGLANMRNRAAGIGADLQIKATPGAGTEVRLIYGIKGPLTDRTNGSGHSNLDSDAATEQLRVK